MQDIISKEEILTLIDNPSLPVYVFDEIDSTNLFAKSLNDDFALVVADAQSKGRGRLGREFFSPKGTGIYMSLKAHIPSLYENVPFVTTLASVAVHKAIKKLYDIDSGIKWVNDIYIGKKKVSGILCEIADSESAVIGIGINFAPSLLPDDLKDIVGFLPKALVTRNMLIGEVAKNLMELIKLLPDSSFMEYYKAHSIVLGKEILCIQGENTFKATATDIDAQGGLKVKTEDEEKVLSSGEITLRFMN